MTPKPPIIINTAIDFNKIIFFIVQNNLNSRETKINPTAILPH
jgi:hypothetical protein